MVEVLSFIALIFAIIPHEVAHGVVANWFGDPTAKNVGRLSFNPIVHVDILGSLILPGFLLLSGSGFILGWAKPVPIRPNNFSNPLKDMMWVAFAGPLTNISLAIVSSVIYKSIITLNPADQTILSYFLIFLISFIQINVILAIFNLLPIPPLDGSRIILPFLPSNIQTFFYRIEPYGFIIIFGLAYLGLLTKMLILIVIPILKLLL